MVSNKNASGIEFMTEENVKLWRMGKKKTDKEYWLIFFKTH